jgi:glyoxylase-like metal-dependent hydrolase (beta-lactamase superfamily II)
MHEPTKQPKPYPVVVGALATNCWLYPLIEPSPGKDTPCAVIDPGADPDVIIARMKRLQLYPTFILLTHGHFDHLAALPALVSHFSHTFPEGQGLEIGIHQADAPYLGPDAYRVHRNAFQAAAGSSAYVDALWQPLPAATKLLSEGDSIGPFTVLHLPGHSPGSIGLYDTAAQVLLSGDTLFKQGMGRTDLPGGDWTALQHSLDRLFALDGAIRVYPGHGPETTIAAEQ